MSKTNLTLDQKKDWAKTLITKDNFSQKAAAEKVGVSPQTINKWYKDGKWERLKKSILLTREEQMSNLLEELSELNELIKDLNQNRETKKEKEGKEAYTKEYARLADIRRKLVKDIKELETKANIEDIIDSCLQLIDFAREVDLKQAQEFSAIVDAFIRSKL